MDSNLQKAALFTNFWNSSLQEFTVFTSGSTAEPKPFILHKNKIIASCNRTRKFLNILPTDAVFCCLPANKVGGLMQIARALVWDIPVQVIEPSLNPFLAGNIRGTITSLTPMQLHHILQNKESKNILNGFRIVLIGGEDLNPTIENKLAELNPIFYATYGMTETYSHIAMRRVNHDNLFYPMDGIEIMLNADKCLGIKAEITDDAWLFTQDVAEITDGGFKIIGRQDNMVNSGGIKINAEVVETKLLQWLDLPANSIMYAGIKDPIFGQKAVLFINGDILHQLPDLRPFFILNKFEKPREIIKLSHFIYTDTGKISRKKTMQLYLDTKI